MYTMKGKVAPMSVMKRVFLIFKSKANRALDRMEDFREILDYFYQRQLEMFTQVRRSVKRCKYTKCPANEVAAVT